MLLFVHLYNYGVLHCGLIFDLVKKFIDELNEKTIELLLYLLKNCGFKLRSDDPGSLKIIVQMVHDKAASITSVSEFGKRVEFMLSTIMDLKNNKRKNFNFDLIEQINRTKKLIIGYLRKHRNTESLTVLRISLAELFDPEHKGRWWMVGSSMAGASSHYLDKQKELLSEAESQIKNSKLLKIARKYGMNTDLRRSLFSIVMTSEDYLDAFERIMRIKLKSKQDRELAFVIFQCCQKVSQIS